MKTCVIGAALALLLPACGDGSVSLESAALNGTVYEVDGQSLDLSGVDVTLVETGEIATTDATGEFSFPDLPAGTYTLDFHTPLSQLAFLEEPGAGEGEREGNDEEIEDGAGRPRVEVTGEGGDIDVRVTIDREGNVKEFTMGDFDDRHAVAHLHLAEGREDRVEGSIKLSETIHGQRFKVAVYGLDAGDVIEIVIGETSVGVAEANADGVACLVRESGDLPLGVEALAGLFGRRLVVKIGGEIVLVGEIPDLPAKKEREDEGGEEEPRDGEGEGEGSDEKPGEGEGGEEEPGGGDGEEPR